MSLFGGSVDFSFDLDVWRHGQAELRPGLWIWSLSDLVGREASLVYQALP